jgi:O-antigen ligase
LAFVIPILFGLVKSSKVSRELKWLQLLLAGLFIVAIILSYTRAAWLSLMGAAGVYVLVLLKLRFRTVVLTAIAAIGLFLSVKNELYMKLQKNKQDSSQDFGEHVQSMSNINTDASNLERINRWKSAWRMWKDRPLVGFGPGTYQFQYAPFQHPNEKTVISTNNADMGNAHSEYLGPLSEQGLPGMILVIVLVSVVFWRGFNTYHRLPEGFLKTITLSLLLALTTYFLHGFLNNFLDVDKASALVWASIAALAAIELYHVPVINHEK